MAGKSFGDPSLSDEGIRIFGWTFAGVINDGFSMGSDFPGELAAEMGLDLSDVVSWVEGQSFCSDPLPIHLGPEILGDLSKDELEKWIAFTVELAKRSGGIGENAVLQSLEIAKQS